MGTKELHCIISVFVFKLKKRKKKKIDLNYSFGHFKSGPSNDRCFFMSFISRKLTFHSYRFIESQKHGHILKHLSTLLIPNFESKALEIPNM